MKKKQFKHRCLCLLFLCLLLCSVRTAVPAAAAAKDRVTCRIPVACQGGNPREVCCIVMEESGSAKTSEPLTVRLKAGEEGAFLTEYSQPGTWHYRIRQQTGPDGRIRYDERVYLLDVYVTEDEKGLLRTEPVIYTEGSSEKKAELRFKNEAAETPSKSQGTDSVQTGDSAELLLHAGLFLLSAAGIILLRKRIR